MLHSLFIILEPKVKRILQYSLANNSRRQSTQQFSQISLGSLTTFELPYNVKEVYRCDARNRLSAVPLHELYTVIQHFLQTRIPPETALSFQILVNPFFHLQVTLPYTGIAVSSAANRSISSSWL
jgi:hypothetical protein